jgi:hypothetical protein
MALNPPKIESIQYDPTTDTIDRYLRRRITGSSSIYKASLDIMLCHMADFHQMTLEILCNKYKLDFDQVLKDLQEDETYRAMMVHPLMNTLHYLSKDELEEGADAVVSKVHEETVVEKKPIKKKRKFKIVATDSPKPEEDNKTVKISEYFVSKEKTNRVTVSKNS